MPNSLKNEILELSNYVRNTASKHPYIKDIAGYIEEMLKCFDGDNLNSKDRIEKLAIGLDRLVTDDYEFYTSKIGVVIAKTISRILSQN